MKKCFLATVLGVFMIAIIPSYGQSLWQELPGSEAPSTGKRMIVPNKYKVFSLDQNAMLALLHQLGTQPESGATILIPNPDGKEIAFNIWETPVMPPTLQAQFANIRTYTATAINNPYVSAKIDFTAYGFHAMVYTPGGKWIIDPYSNSADGYYISFYQSDAAKSAQPMICEFGNNNLGDLTNGQPDELGAQPQIETPITAQRISQNTKRTYRLALSCTGEYAHAVAGNNPTLNDVMSAMTTSINRVNGIYEREIDVTLVFIPNEANLIYLNPNTDPFTANNNGNQLLGQNQTNTTQVIGSANYDIGHIFSTGGGGIAFLGGVCKNNWKAQGVTGSPNPVGDAFDVDYVSHEMGHQFGANHAFNDCDGNENQSTAYEPGSGSSIMCYAGICGSSNNIQLNSDDYFHAISLSEISDYLSGMGGTCAVTDTLSLDLPEIDSFNQEYNIPAQTPFELTAPAVHTGQQNDSLTYCWEEWDLGNYKQPDINSAQFTTGPIFRTEPPVMNNPIRVFPPMLDILFGDTNNPGEKFVMVSRDMHFKLTVRNINNGWGGYNISDDQQVLHITNTGAPFKITSQDTPGIIVSADTGMTVTWDVAGTNTAPINCDSVDIYLSADGGLTYPILISSGVPNTGSATISLPDSSITNGRIKVKGHNNIFFNIGSQNIKILPTTTGISQLNMNHDLEVYPNPATNQITVKNRGSQEVQGILFNQIGQIAWKGQIQEMGTIHTGGFSRGIYLLRLTVEKDQSRVTKKIILQ